MALPRSSPPTLPPRRHGRAAAAFVLGSLLLHAGGLWLLDRWLKDRPPPKKPTKMELVQVETPPPPPPPPPEEKPPEPEPPKPPPPKVVKVKPPPVKTAEVKPPPEPPKEQPPPPPNEEPPKEAPPPQKPVPVVVGISLSNTGPGGAVALPVGNTLYGKAADKAADPNAVKPYVAPPKYTPVFQVDTQPEVTSDCQGPYPDEARKAGVEGTVVLSVTVDAEGKVSAVKLLRGLGYGLDEAAMGEIRRCRFKPATKGGEKVATTISYNYTFLLD
jgi:protein TonB